MKLVTSLQDKKEWDNNKDIKNNIEMINERLSKTIETMMNITNQH